MVWRLIIFLCRPIDKHPNSNHAQKLIKLNPFIHYKLLIYGTGPPSDHTTGAGFYALCDGTQLKDSNDTCEMYSVIADNQERLKITFWYFYYGDQLKGFSLVQGGSVLWNTSTQSNQWVQAQVDLPLGSYTVYFGKRYLTNGWCVTTWTKVKFKFF